MNIYESINAIMQEVPAIGKTEKNKQQGFNFRGIDTVMNAIQPLLAKHKVFVVPQTLEQIREERQTKNGGNLIYSILKIKFTFYAEDGTFVEAITTGEGMDSGDKASNKAMAIAMKYALFQTFCIPTGDDPDAECHDIKAKFSMTKEMVETISSLLKKVSEINSMDYEEMIKDTLKQYKVDKIENLNEANYLHLLNRLKKPIPTDK